MDVVDNQIDNIVLAELGGVDTQVIVFRHTPFLSRIKAVVIRSALIGLSNDMFGAIGIDAVFFNSFLFSEIHPGIDENVDAVTAVPENIIRTSADDDTTALLGDFFDKLML